MEQLAQFAIICICYSYSYSFFLVFRKQIINCCGIDFVLEFSKRTKRMGQQLLACNRRINVNKHKLAFTNYVCNPLEFA